MTWKLIKSVRFFFLRSLVRLHCCFLLSSPDIMFIILNETFKLKKKLTLQLSTSTFNY
jgi:hypothetical protein